MPRSSQVGGINLAELAYVVGTLLVVFSPMLLCRRGSPSGSDGEGRGNGPPRPRTPPTPPGGGIALVDAEPSRVRLRGPGRLAKHSRVRDRRPAREPVREPSRTARRA